MDLLPFDVTETFLDFMESPHDLLFLSLTSRYWEKLIIPRHIQYRKLHLGSDGQNLSLWNHLAERKDLAKNIREVRLTDMSREWEQRPTTLVEPSENQTENKAEIERNFLQAFKNFEQLEKFTWNSYSCPPFMVPYQNPKFLRILSNLSHLSGLDLASGEKRTDPTLHIWQPLFEFERLKFLYLRGSFWGSFTLGSQLTSMLLRCPDLQELSLTYDTVSPPFVKCFFPRLRKLFLYAAPGVIQSSRDVLDFIKAHKTIQDLTWYPASDLPFSAGSLPSLERISSTHELTMSILQDRSIPCRPLKSITGISINSDSMKVLSEIDGTQVQELYLCHYDTVQNIRQLGKLFPTITTLEIPRLGMLNYSDTLDDHILTFSCFPSLECILDTSIWRLIYNLRGEEARRIAITKLARECPNLRLITFHESHLRKITLHRDGENVLWEDIADTRD